MPLRLKILLVLLLGLVGLVLHSCTNPFAPSLADGNTGDNILSDQTTIEGVFNNFRYAYIFKDTVVYGKLLADDFVFIYYKYEPDAHTYSWGRSEDMLTTYRLFQTAQSLNLVWNEVIVSTGDSLLQNVSRGLTLTIVFSSNDIVTLQGSASFRLMRNSIDDVWKINQWTDMSY